MWTLAYTTLNAGGNPVTVEKSLADWGICDDFSRSGDNKARSTVTLRTTEKFDAGATQFQTMNADGLTPTWAGIYRDREKVGEGGTLWAQGYFDEPVRENRGGIQHVNYQLHNVWYLLEHHIFQQPRRMRTGYADGEYTYTNYFTCESYLGEKLVYYPNGSYLTALQTNGEQVEEIINWLNECFNATKRGAEEDRDDAQDVLAAGTIEPRQYFGVKRANSMLCSEAILDVLRLQPDTILWVDESKSPPELNVRTIGKWNYETTPPTFVDYTNLPEVVINITEEQEREITVSRQTWQRVPGVVIFYWRVTTIDGVPMATLVTDKYPADVNLYTPRLAVHFIQVAGGSSQHEVAEVITAPLAGAVGTQAEQKAWWIAHDKSLQDPLVDVASISIVQSELLDEYGNVLNLGAYPNELIDSVLPKWASQLTPALVATRATARAVIGFTRYADAAKLIKETKPRSRVVQKTIKVTNAYTGTLSILTAQSSGDDIPLGVAESVARSCAAEQHAGTIEFVETQLRTDIKFGYRYKLVGPNSVFENCIPQQINERPCSGLTTVTFGPAPLASIDFLLELLRATRFRTDYRLPSGRATGSAGGGAEVDTGSDAPLDDTVHSPGGNQFEAATFDQTDEIGGKTVVSKDAESEEIAIARRGADGKLKDGAPSLSIKLGDFKHDG